MSALLLDTCAIIFIADGRPIELAARQQVIAAAAADGIMVSPISAWEIGLLSAKKAIAFDPDPIAWFNAFLASPGVRLAGLTPEIAMQSCFLPSPALHGDPADRLLIATARALGIPIMTRDHRILDYARAGPVAAIAC